MKVNVLGAGIGGLTTALQLHREGIDCVIYEKSPQIRELGVGINVLPYAVKELADLELLDQLDDVGIRTREVHYLHRLGPEILRKPSGTHAGFTVPQFSIHRGQLQQLLLRAVRERLGPDAVRPDHQLISFDQDTETVCAHFVDQHGRPMAPVHGDVLVGADGIHSTVRSQLFPEEGPPHWNGVMMWRGAADWPTYGTGGSMIIAGGTPAKLVVYPIARGGTEGTHLTNWVICVRTGNPGDPPPARQDWSRPADPKSLQQHLDRFHTPLVDHAKLVLATQQPYVFPMCDRDPVPFWSQGRVTLLGDAAHPMYPMGSNGAGQAILDATTLAGHLARHADPANALQAYQHDRLPLTTELTYRVREGGPERIIDVIELLAPDGFTDIADIIDPAELEAMVTSYSYAA